jgi:assimilatory nitrate reductase catalytic subunit
LGDENERSGLLFRAHANATPDDALLTRIESLLALDNPHVLRYVDKQRGQRRTIHLNEGEVDTTLAGFMLAGDTSAQAWISTLLKEQLPAHALRRALLVPGATPTVSVVSKGQQVCACFNVTDVAIGAHLNLCQGNLAQRLGSLQSALKCGTNCGSCVPQLQRMVRSSLPTA